MSSDDGSEVASEDDILSNKVNLNDDSNNILRNKQPNVANNKPEDEDYLNQLPQGFSMEFEQDVQQDMVMNFTDIDNLR